MNNLEAALFVAAWFGPVLPLCWPVFGPDGQARCGCGQGHQGRDVGKAPIGRLAPNGFKDASTDPELIRRWWATCPEANVGLSLEPAGLVFIGPDCQEAFDYFVERGLPPTVTRVSKNIGFLYRRPEGCPATRRARSGWGDILSVGYVVVWGRHAGGERVYLDDLDRPMPECPAWAVDLLREVGTGTSLRPEPEVEPPPVPLVGDALRLWYGELACCRRDPGPPKPVAEVVEIDRSRTLFHVGLALARAGLQSEGLLALAVERYDRKMNFDKYTDRRDGQVRYEEIARKAVGLARLDLRPAVKVEAECTQGGLPEEPGEFTDRGTARLLARLLRQQVAYVPGWGWVWWDGRRWARNDEGYHVRRVAMDALVVYYARLLQSTADPERRREYAERAKKVQAVHRINAALELLKAELEQAMDVFDRDPYLLNTPAGVVDLRTGSILAHTPELYQTRLTAVRPDFEAECPRFLGFLSEIFAGNAGLIAYVQRLLGYALLGDNRERLFVVFWGRGKNGKSTLIETLSMILGDYVAETPPESFQPKDRDQPRNDLARLAGVRLVTARETREGRRLDPAIVKHVTGGDRLAVRFLHREFFEFVPKFLPILITNHKPRSPGDDPALWDRLRLVPFTVQIPPERRDNELKFKLAAAEGPAILAWLIRGCQAYLKGGLQDPPEVLAETAAWREESEWVLRWIREECVCEPGARAALGELYQAYLNWCTANEVESMEKRAFGRVLTNLGFSPDRTSSLRYRRGIRLRTQADREVVA